MMPFLIFGIYAIAVEPGAMEGWAYLIFSLISFAALGIWVMACKNTNDLSLSRAMH
jgi:hypothetical protein